MTKQKQIDDKVEELFPQIIEMMARKKYLEDKLEGFEKQISEGNGSLEIKKQALETIIEYKALEFKHEELQKAAAEILG